MSLVVPLKGVKKMNLEALEQCGDSGFLPREDPIITIPEKRFDPLYRAMIQLPGAFPRKQVLAMVYAELHTMDPDFHVSDLSESQCHALFRDLGFLAAALVHSTQRDPQGIVHIPQRIAIPLCALADRLDVPPTLPYFSYALHNWYRLSPRGLFTTQNMRTIRHFVPDMDEEWFILIHLAIEDSAVKIVLAIREILKNVERFQKDGTPVNFMDRLGGNLSDITLALGQMISLFREMPRCCSEWIYFKNTRPQIMPFKNVVYNGVPKYDEQPQSFIAGETGAQSCIAPMLDAFFRITHETTNEYDFVREMRKYMLPHHRAVIETIEKAYNMRDFLISPGRDFNYCANQWNSAVRKFQEFRHLHLHFAEKYVFSKVESDDGESARGTGGTPAALWLAQLRDDTGKAFIRA